MNQPGTDMDVELLRSISGGDRQAFSNFYDRYARLLFSMAFRILDDQQEAENVLQDVFVHVWDNAGTYHSGLGKPASWVVTLTRNKAIDYLHAYQHRAKLQEQLATEKLVRAPGSPTANDAVRKPESVDLITRAVAELPEEQRKAIEAAFFSGLTQAEMAETLREPIRTIKGYVRQGMLKLRDRLEGVV